MSCFLTHSYYFFIPGLKRPFSANLSHRSFPSSGLTVDSPDCLVTDTSEHIRFLLFSFSVFHFLVFGSVRWIKLTCRLLSAR